MKIKKFIWLLFLLSIIQNVNSQSCVTDAGCQQCNFYVFLTPIGLYGYYNCDQCYQNHTLNTTSHICECNSGYYASGNGTCASCSILCITCNNGSSCNACDPQFNRVYNNGQCECANGYQSSNGGPMCIAKPNILLIVLSSIGSFLCLTLSFICCWVIRFRRSTQQIHESGEFRNNSRQAEIQIYVEDQSHYSANGMTASGLWNVKQHEFKPEETCSICLDSQPLFMTQCGHYFHSKCIYEWLNNHSTCPNCNRDIHEKQLRRWCDGCKKVLMPIIRNVMIKKSGKKKRELIKSTPIQQQLCDDCQNKQNFTKQSMKQSRQAKQLFT